MEIMTKILLVEDDEDIVETLLLFLRVEGFEVLHIADGATVITSIKTFQPDLVIMDIMLPNKNGFDCTQDIRKVCNVPIIMLTARIAQADVINGLQTGADDYLCKPFDITELVLRIRALINRTKGQVVFDSWKLNEGSLSISLNDKKVLFSLVEFQLFSLLYNSPNNIFSRDKIMDLVYKDYRVVTDRTVDSHIKNIRKKLKQADIDPAHIESVYGAGYRFKRELKKK